MRRPRQTANSQTFPRSTSARKLTRFSSYLKINGAVALFIALAATLINFPAPAAKADSEPTPAVAALGKLSLVRTTFNFGSPSVNLLAANADGSEQVTLTQLPPHVPTTSTWSPDGTKIAFTDSLANTNEIFVVNAAGGASVNLTNTGSSIVEANPDWSVSNKIAYERGNQIWTMNGDGSNQAAFSGIAQPAPTAPAWSPNGSQLAFVSAGEIYVINANGTNERRVTNNSTVDSNPDWSADGTKIVFSRGTSGIAVINVDGTNETPLTANDDREPVWSSDGTKIAFVRKGTTVNGIYLMDANGANQTRVIADVQQSRGNEHNSPAWQPVQSVVPSRPKFDFDGDRKADISVFRPSNGTWYLLNSQTGFAAPQFGAATDRIVPADFDGDGKTDVAVFRPAAGDESKVYILNSASNTVRTDNFALADDVVLAADWDGDTKADLTAYRGGAGSAGQSFFFYRPSTQPGVNFISVPWGAGGDKPVLGDYDADGKADAAVFRPDSGVWYVRQSSNGQFFAAQFGGSSDVPLTADFDGDSKTDIAVFRPSDGGWYRLNSTNGQFVGLQFGASSDIPVPADYDGDGKADIAVWRPANGEWYRISSQSGQFSAVPFGSSADKPIPAAFR